MNSMAELYGLTHLYPESPRSAPPAYSVYTGYDNAGRLAYKDQVNLYAYVGSDPVNLADSTGENSYVVARRLSSFVGSFNVGHSFVVTHARYVGDSSARIHSFDPLANGRMGNMSDPARAAGMGKSTRNDDRAAWASLRRDTTQNIAEIKAPDRTVDAVAGAVKENRPYTLTPNSTETMLSGKAAGYPTPDVNSNSAAFAIGDRATAIASGNPGAGLDRGSFNMTLPGSSASPKVEFSCTVELRATHGC